MDFKELVAATRSVRRFREREHVPMAALEALVDMARLSASAGNLQPLRWVLVNAHADCARVFGTLGWAAYLPRWSGPEVGERPAAYLVLCAEQERDTLQVDAGIALQTVMLGARSMGLAACVFGSVNRERLAEHLELPGAARVLYVVALGRPVEEVALEPLARDGDIKYWRDAESVHHVPKRALDDVILARLGNGEEEQA